MRAYESRAQARLRRLRKSTLMRGVRDAPEPRSVDGTVGFTPRLGKVRAAEPRRDNLLAPPGKGVYPNVYTLRLTSLPLRVLLWLFFSYEANGSAVFRRGWQNECAKQCGLNRPRVSDTGAPSLAKHGLLVPMGGPVQRFSVVRFCIERFVG